ncbi:MAG: ABC transporter substrate-binding protein [Desulfurococcus sp.]|nr:ABC transporter substrate-binding protein [Desulfurococcus sp.]
MSRYIPLLALAMILASIVFIPLLTVVEAQEVKPGPASDKIIAVRKTIEEVPDALSTGDIYAYLFSVRPVQAAVLQGMPGIKLYTAPAGLIELTLNPAPVHVEVFKGNLTLSEAAARLGVPEVAIVNIYYSDGNTIVELGAYPGKGVNPLAFKQIRFALNYLIDRATVTSTIMRGFAVPMYTFLSQYDPDYALIADIVAKYEFTYNPDYVNAVVTDILTKIGAVKVGGKWTYEGSPITLKFIIRPEDERRDIGYLFSAELKKLGFTVDDIEMPFAQAIDVIYGTDPAEFQWHIYTAGWGKGGINRYDSAAIAQFCAPWFGNMPGWQEPAFWNYRNDKIDDLTLRIYNGNYTSKAERDELYRNATELCIDDSIRIWVATRLDAWPVRTDVKGVTLDLGAGLRGIWNLREMYVEGKSELKVGHLYVWTASSAWNWWGGFSDVYSADFAGVTYDPSVWAHPFNGEPIPFRTPYAVETAGPKGELDVPSNAVIWDVNAKKWVNVAPGTKAKSRVVFDFSKLVGTKFHNGITITFADVVGYLAFLFDLVYDPVYSSLEPRLSSQAKPWADTVKGFVFDPEKKRVTVYVDYWHFDENYIASWASFSPVNPVEIHAVTFDLALNRRAETNYVLYQRKGYSWFSLVWPEHVTKVNETLKNWRNNETAFNWVNKYANGLLSWDEWQARINADIQWIAKYNLAWISYGPFMLTTLDTQNQILVLEAFRDPSYPFKKGDWYFGEPVLTSIVSVSLETPAPEVPGKIVPGLPANITVKLSGIPPFSLKYIVKDPAGAIIATGSGVKVSEDTFSVSLSPELTKNMVYGGRYTLLLIGTSEEIAVPTISKQVISVASISEAARIEAKQKPLSEVLGEVRNATLRQIDYILSQLEGQLTPDLDTLRKQLGSALADTATALVELITTYNSITSDQYSTSLQNAVSTITGQVSTQLQSVRGDVATLSQEVASLKSSVSDTQNAVSTLQTYVIVNIVLTLVAIILAIVALIRKPKA